MNHSPLSTIEQARFHMIEQQIRPWNVLDPRVLQLLSEIKREDFVPAAHKGLAFADFELPLGHGATMLAPKVEARMLQNLQLTGLESVLEIGTGSGYMAALLGRMARHVLSLEINPALAAKAAQNLSQAIVANVDVKVADGAHPPAIADTFDVIVLSGSVAQIPPALIAKLKTGGRLAAIVGDAPVMRMTLVTRTEQGIHTTQPWDTLAPRLENFPELEAFSF